MKGDLNEAQAQYKNEGWCLLREWIPLDLCETFRSYLDVVVQKEVTKEGLEAQFERTGDNPASVRKLRRLFWEDPNFWRDNLGKAGLFTLAYAFVSPAPALIRHAAFLKPAGIGSAVELHQDQFLWGVEYPRAVSIWIALARCTSQNGCLVLYKNSHHFGLLQHNATVDSPWHPCLDVEQFTTGQEIEMEIGDVLIWHRYLVHGSGPNLSSDARPSMVVVFADTIQENFAAQDVFRLPAIDIEQDNS